MPGPTEDQRQHERTELSVEIRVVLLSQGEGQSEGGCWEPGEERTCVSRDLSAGGVGLRMDGPLPEGQPVLVFVPGIERTVRVFGRVCHSRDAEDGGAWVGVRFYGMPVELERTDWVRSIADAA